MMMMMIITVSKVTAYGLDDQSSIPGGDSDFFFRQRVQIDPRAHRASYPMGTAHCFPREKAAGA